jgi:hypothetical protein
LIAWPGGHGRPDSAARGQAAVAAVTPTHGPATTAATRASRPSDSGARHLSAARRGRAPARAAPSPSPDAPAVPRQAADRRTSHPLATPRLPRRGTPRAPRRGTPNAPRRGTPQAPRGNRPSAPSPQPSPSAPTAGAPGPAAAPPAATPGPAPVIPPVPTPAPAPQPAPCVDHSHASDQGMAHGKGHHKC